MCGIAGLLSVERPQNQLLERLTETLRHRGPDDSGYWFDDSAGVAFGHRRLAVVDLSPHGRQPMISADGRLVLTYNGEIYNHRELRSMIDDAGLTPAGGWRGHSDTETLLECIAAWGLERALALSVGMFAFALWDRADRKLFLVRDRFGEKPLYYGWVGRQFVFGSELKAIAAHPDFDASINRTAVETLVERTYIPAPHSIYQGIFKLLPGCILAVSLDALRHPRKSPPGEGESNSGVKLSRYWSYAELLSAGAEKPIHDEQEAVEALEQALATAVRGQSIADVPVGAFLSGGLDSSTVIALYQKHSPVPVRTFTIGFHEAAFNEAEAAKAVAAHLGTVHHECYVTSKAAQDVIPLLPSMTDEPFADSSQIPTFLISRFARGQVKVALTGDGGDELFGGYSRYTGAASLWSSIRHVPQPVRRAAGAALGLVPDSLWNAAGRAAYAGRNDRSDGRIAKALRVAARARTFEEVYASTLHQWPYEPSPVGQRADVASDFDFGPANGCPDLIRAMHCDVLAYLPDSVLCKVDRAAMAVSLETRVPFLDHRVAEIAARLPLRMKTDGKRGKLIIRRLLGRQLPRELFERPKSGFALPIGEWLKGPLRPWAEDLLSSRAMVEDGLLDVDVVRRRWNDHLSGRRNSAQAMWAVLMLQSWLRSRREPAAV